MMTWLRWKLHAALVVGLLTSPATALSEEATAGDVIGSAVSSGPQMMPGAIQMLWMGGYWEKLGAAPVLEVGRWAEYEFERPDRAPGIYRMAVVPDSSLTDARYRVIELRLAEPTGDRHYFKLLLSPGKNSERAMVAMLIKQAGMPALPVLLDDGSRIDPMSADSLRELEFKKLGVERLETPAGSFRCRHVQVWNRKLDKKVMDVWVDLDRKVPLWPIVRSVSHDGETTTLRAVGEGAKSDLPPMGGYLPRKPKPKPKPGGGHGHPPQGTGSERTK